MTIVETYEILDEKLKYSKFTVDRIWQCQLT